LFRRPVAPGTRAAGRSHTRGVTREAVARCSVGSPVGRNGGGRRGTRRGPRPRLPAKGAVPSGCTHVWGMPRSQPAPHSGRRSLSKGSGVPPGNREAGRDASRARAPMRAALQRSLHGVPGVCRARWRREVSAPPTRGAPLDQGTAIVGSTARAIVPGCARPSSAFDRSARGERHLRLSHEAAPRGSVTGGAHLCCSPSSLR
jgi:hypothetical protein